MIYTFKRQMVVVSRILFVSLGILLLLPSESYAESYTGQCDEQLSAVEGSIGSAHFIGNKAATNRSNLLAKLAEAQAKVYREKYADAITKLGDISETATELANASKPKLDDASAINYAVSSAISCVGLLP